jgi:hypothetical protein
MPESRGPSPSSVPPRRRATIAPHPAVAAQNRFAVAAQIPRRGWPDSTIWPDTGIFLTLGTAPELPPVFTRHFRGRVRVPRKIRNELRGHSNTQPATRHDYRRKQAATAAIKAFFIGDGVFPQPELTPNDIPLLDEILDALRNLPGGKGKGHSGEAELIALAVREARQTATRQVLLANDGGASVVAARYKVPSRHAADVLAEFSCGAHGVTPRRCLQIFQEACDISAPPAHCLPKDESFFVCIKSESGCSQCDVV